MKISKRAETALKKSIKQWERRAMGEVVNAMCPLCTLYAFSAKCGICPVAKSNPAPSAWGCSETPYDDWDYENQSTDVAKREVDFLKSLLPKEGE